jgi:hypothetical protein
MPQLTGVDDSLSVGYLRRAAYVGRTHGDLPIPLLGNRSISPKLSSAPDAVSLKAKSPLETAPCEYKVADLLFLVSFVRQ